MQRALASWSGKGTFIFTSSSGVMKPEAGEPLTEDTALHSVGISDRTDRLANHHSLGFLERLVNVCLLVVTSDLYGTSKDIPSISHLVAAALLLRHQEAQSKQIDSHKLNWPVYILLELYSFQRHQGHKEHNFMHECLWHSSFLNPLPIFFL